MKRFSFSILVTCCLFLIFAFKLLAYEPNYSTAEVARMEGFYLFSDSKPVMPFDSLGMVDIGFVSGTQYETIRTNLIKRSRKKYPHADGLILKLNKKGLDKALVIKFR